LDQIKSIRSQNPNPASSFKGAAIASKNAITKDPIEKILGVKCQEQNGMVKAVIGRTIELGVRIGKEMGVNSWAGFGGTDDQAVVDGDMAVLEDELQNVLIALQNANINIVAIHNHMINENPRMLFLHFWGSGSAKDLAEGIKRALYPAPSKIVDLDRAKASGFDCFSEGCINSILPSEKQSNRESFRVGPNSQFLTARGIDQAKSNQ
jgi:hypothetical protein